MQHLARHWRVRSVVAGGVALAALFATSPLEAATAAAAGGKCTKAGLTAKTKAGAAVVCTKKGTKLSWAAAAAATTAPTTAAPTAAPATTAKPAETAVTTPPASAAWKAILATAETEGKVVFYTAMGSEQSDRLAKAFTAKHPKIKVEFVRGATNEMISRLDQERTQRLDGADVAIVTSGQWYSGLADDNKMANLSEFPSLAFWKGDLKNYVQTRGYFTVQVIPFVIGWNSKQITTPIKGYKDLLRPDLKGKIGTLDLVSPTIDAFYAYLDATYGPDFVKQLAAQGIRLYQSTEPLAQAVSAGEVSVAAFMTQGGAQNQVNQGAPFASFVPSPAIGTEIYAGAVGWSKRPNAARVFTDWLLTPDGQQAVNGAGNGISPLGVKLVPTSIDADPKLLNASALGQVDIDALTKLYQPILRNR